jgi:exosortase
VKSSTPYLIFVSLCLLASAVLWRPLLDTFALALHDDPFTHILLILPISAALIFSEWETSCLRSCGSVWGFSLVVAGILSAVLAKLPSAPLAEDDRLSASMIGLILIWVGAFVLCFGRATARSHLFPLCFLLWMVPFPAFLLAKVVQMLQQGSAIAASALFSAFGVPVIRDGIDVAIPGLQLEVARECSSIRSSLMLLITTMVLVHVLLKKPWRKILLILLAVPLAVAKNGLRIFAIGMLATRVDPGFLNGRLHRHGGILFFLLALATVLVLLWFLRRGEKETSAAVREGRGQNLEWTVHRRPTT